MLKVVSSFEADTTGIGELHSFRIDLKGLAWGLGSLCMNGLSLGNGFIGSGSSTVVHRYGDHPTCLEPRLEGRAREELAVCGVPIGRRSGVSISLSSIREPGLGGVGGRAGRGPRISTMV